MPLTINRDLFDRVMTSIAERGRINMLYWAVSQDSVPVESTDAIRSLPLLDDCPAIGCIGGLICHLATSDEIAHYAQAARSPIVTNRYSCRQVRVIVGMHE